MLAGSPAMRTHDRITDAATAQAFVDKWVEGSNIRTDDLPPGGPMRGILSGDLSGIDIAISNAGLRRQTPFLDMPLAEWREILSVALDGGFILAKAVAPSMIARGGGAIVNIASTRAHQSEPHSEAYAAAKGGVLGMTLVAARDLSPLGIRVVTIAPGTINTPAYGKAADQLEQYWGPQVPFPKRMGRSTEYARLAQNIIENDYLNGEIIRLDGALRFPPK